jgi:hypothetical protein
VGGRTDCRLGDGQSVEDLYLIAAQSRVTTSRRQRRDTMPLDQIAVPNFAQNRPARKDWLPLGQFFTRVRELSVRIFGSSISSAKLMGKQDKSRQMHSAITKVRLDNCLFIKNPFFMGYIFLALRPIKQEGQKASYGLPFQLNVHYYF